MDPSEDWSRIHNVDQRARAVIVTHDAIEPADAPGPGPRARRTVIDGGRVEVRQRGSGSEAFEADTSTVVWPMCRAVAEAFCDATQRWKTSEGARDDGRGRTRAETCALAKELVITPDTRVIEVGAGIGLLGIVLARIGAKRSTITDDNVRLLSENVSSSGGSRAECKRLRWASPTSANASEWDAVQAFVETYVRENDGERPHLIVGTDVMYSQSRATCRALASTIAALADDDTVVIIGFEDRGDWGQVAHFFEHAETCGLRGEADPFGEDDDDWLLIRLSKRGDSKSP